ncbi:anti-sigma factor domain-containing protein [Streptomyces sp. NPDC020141]|uniref:anti-sigma factor n=1 Tax=Streptomyces sp. NPDC020141 TaxID=3365065 RepID=UPI0037896980
MTAVDVHTLSGAYVLHALPDDERAAFERHLSSCAACAQETRELGTVAARLGLALAVTPPPGLKEAVMRRIGTVRQENPRTASIQRVAARPFRGRGLARWAMAACLAAAAGLGGTAVWQHQEAGRAEDRARAARVQLDRVASVLGAPDAKVRTVALPGGAGGTVVVSRERDRAVFATEGMARPPAGKVYQLWYEEGGAMRPAGLMDPGRTSEAVLMAGRLGGAKGMGITLEPAGGSPLPTSAPLAAVAFG